MIRILEKKIVVSWKKACFSKQDGGLGLRDLSLQNQALLQKLAWRVFTEGNYVFCFLRSRFLKERYEPKSYWFTSPIWGGIKSHVFGLLEESIWMVGRHSKVRFLEDNWFGFPLINLISEDQSLNPPLGSLVWDFVGPNIG